MALNNYPVNRSTFRLIRGVENDIQFLIHDLDRRLVDSSDFTTATIYISDPVTETLLLSRDLAVNTAGLYSLTIQASEAADWPSGPLRWGIVAVRTGDGSTTMLWTDMNYTPYSTLQVMNGPIPGPAQTITIAWADLMQLSDNKYYTSSLPGAAAYGFNNGMQSFYISMTNFTGTIRIDGSLSSDPTDDPASPDWFQVDLQTYGGYTGSVTLNEQGNYVWMRMVVGPTVGQEGTVDQTQYKR